MYAGDPKAMSEALEELEEALWGDDGASGGQVIGLYDRDRDAAWARLGRV